MIKHSFDNGKDNYVLMTAGEIPAAIAANEYWMKIQSQGQVWNFDLNQFKKLAETGDESLVARSEKILAQIEDQVPMSRGWRNIDDVVGAIPNVPAFLAGHPQSMRRRERVARDNAPVTVFMDLTSSAAISGDLILRRGITLLALVRLLVEHRSVELWVGAGLGEYSGSLRGLAAWRIDTAPMDLARAAFHIADERMSRLFGYAMSEAISGKYMGGWNKEYMPRLRELAGWSDVLHIPGINYDDPMVKDPVAWLKRTMKQYVGGEQ